MKKNMKGIVLGALALVTVAVASVFSFNVYAANSGGVCPEGVSINGVDVSGMTEEEARTALSGVMSGLSDSEITFNAGDNTVTAKASEVGLSLVNHDVFKLAANYGSTGNLLERYRVSKAIANGEKKDFSLVFTCDEDTLRAFLEANNNVLSTEEKDGTLKHDGDGFSFVAGTEGVAVDIDASVPEVKSQIESEFNGENMSVSLVTTITEPRGTAEQLSAIQDMLGTFTTSLAGSDSGRKQNVANGASLLNGIVLYPGDEISLGDTMAPYTAENGYALAGAYENGQTVQSIGGGICQVSTTVYNAVLLSELAVEERSAHSMTVGYVKPSMDAALAEGVKDFKFKNNQEYPILLEVTVDDDITATIYGKETRDPNRTLEFESVVTSETPAPKTYNAVMQPIGYVQQTSKGHTGYTAELWKIVKENGVEVSRTQVNSSKYKPSPASYDIGVIGADDAATQAAVAAVSSQDEATVNAVVGAYAIPIVDPAAAAPAQ